MSKVKKAERRISTETEYTDAHRFRIWSSIVDDMDLLGKGYRAYHTHIFESFRKWEAQGIEFFNPKGKSLYLDALKADDLYGFLGRKEQLPTGPKRKIETSKVAVLDAFLRAKFPKLLVSNPSGEAPVAHAQMAEALYGLMGKSASNNESLCRTVKALDGVFIHSPFFPDQELERMVNHMGKPGWGIPLIIVNGRPHSGYCVIHKVFMPIRSEYFKNHTIDGEHWDSEDDYIPGIDDKIPTLRMRMDSKNKTGDIAMETWSGIGVVIPHDDGNPMVTLQCHLKCQSTCEIEVSALLVESDYERLGDPFTMPQVGRTELIHNRQGVFGFCSGREHFDVLTRRMIYTSHFRDAIFEAKEKLGWEV
ncbi:MAG: hypothetical protein GW903_07885 [Alphaproteobacteria bacterium]|nr:hypothetical protein [Alphaproteobacteria bacterium]NCQ89180.1 hypothetical protein [Alphaproteobacteria bacterium]